MFDSALHVANLHEVADPYRARVRDRQAAGCHAEITAHVANAAINIPEVPGGPFVMTDAAFVGGQSGGPCINAAGEVVMIVQRANGLVGVGLGAEQIRSRVGRYLEKPVK
jgi:hypothetical protein